MRKPPGLHVKQGLRRRSYGSSGSPSSLYSIFVRCVMCGVSVVVVCIYGESKLKQLES